jgi:uncharacterized metal-binding protein
MPGLDFPKKIVFSCSGAADVAELADRAARLINRRGSAKMYCLAGVGGHVAEIVERTRAAETIAVIDGCDKDCGRHCLTQAGISAFTHIRVTDLGMEKGQSPVNDERIAIVAAKAAAVFA